MAEKTPLYDEHVRLGGKMVEFAGHWLPVQYKGIVAEHNAVRRAAGLFDISHMGQFRLTGPAATETLQNALTNDFSSMRNGQARYSPMCYGNGGTADDLLVYRVSEEDYILVVNASNRAKDYRWIADQLVFGAELDDDSDDGAILALQGPRAAEIIKTLTAEKNIPAKKYRFTPDVCLAGAEVLLSRTGYTGEDGFEIYCDAFDAAAVFNAVLEAGEPFGIVPCGLGARDTLRMEAGMPLYGHELSETITPLEAGLGFFVKMDKKEFTGKAALAARPPERALIGLCLAEPGIAREHCDVYAVSGETIGQTTSGTFSPTLQKAVAMALVRAEYKNETEFLIDIRGKKVKAVQTPLPFYKTNQMERG